MQHDTAIAPHDEGVSDGIKHRDAAKTRQLLLESARHRFAVDGYAATTVRDIAGDAGVNVALINRYFMSKEGLFEACLARAASELDRPAAADLTAEQAWAAMVEQIASSTTGQNSLQLMLLLRSSGDEHAERIRRDTLRTYSESLAAVAGWRPGDAGTEQTMLRAQIAIATGLGVVLLRSSAGVEPLTSATAGELASPLGDALRALLLPGAPPAT